VAFYSEDAMVIRTHREHETYEKKDMVEVESIVIKHLAKKMFNDEDAYKHESLVMMTSQYEKTVEKVENHTKKSFIVRKPVEDV
jgi:hypothetical protein